MTALLFWCGQWATPSEVRQDFNVLSVLHDFRRACLFVLLIVICVRVHQHMSII